MKTENTVINILTERAKEILADCQEQGIDFSPVAFAIKGDEIVDMMAFSTLEKEKIEEFRSVGFFCSAKGCTEVVTIMDSWVRKSSNDEEDEYIKANWDTEKPTAYPESMRQHCLLLNHLDFNSRVPRLGYVQYEIKDGNVVTGKSEMGLEDHGGDLLKDISFGFMIAEAGKMRGSMDNNIGCVKDKYPLLRGVK